MAILPLSKVYYIEFCRTILVCLYFCGLVASNIVLESDLRSFTFVNTHKTFECILPLQYEFPRHLFYMHQLKDGEREERRKIGFQIKTNNWNQTQIVAVVGESATHHVISALIQTKHTFSD